MTGEYKQKCDECGAKVQARSYYRKIKGKFPYLCRACWGKYEATKERP